MVTEISKPSPSGLLHLGSHLHLGELKWGWAGVSADILQPIRKRKGKKKIKYSPATGKEKEKKKKEEGFKSGIWPVLCCGCLVFLHPLGT